MRTLIACSLLLATTPVLAQPNITYDRAATEATNAGCRVTARSARRLWATCNTRETATTLVAKFREIAGGGQVVFGPLCTFNHVEEPRTVRQCDVQLEQSS